MIHPDKCHHPRAKEAFGAIAKAQTMLLDAEERGYVLQQINQARGERIERLKHVSEARIERTAKRIKTSRWSSFHSGESEVRSLRSKGRSPFHVVEKRVPHDGGSLKRL